MLIPLERMMWTTKIIPKVKEEVRKFFGGYRPVQLSYYTRTIKISSKISRKHHQQIRLSGLLKKSAYFNYKINSVLLKKYAQNIAVTSGMPINIGNTIQSIENIHKVDLAERAI
jgi:hypothetical protein